jgi:hypothetical protein
VVNWADQLLLNVVREDKQSGITTVTAQVPRGVRYVMLQSLDGVKGWVTLAVAHVDGLGKLLTFRAPTGRNLRVLGDTNDPHPPTSGARTNFALTSATKPSAPQTISGIRSGGMPGAVTSANDGSTTTPRTVTESDIWKIRGNTLYFFNQLRGLQIIDITNPDAPRRDGTLPLPAVGEDMYILDDTHIVLLAQKGCCWDQSEVIAVTVADGTPAITARLDVNGTINTSRLVGAALYIAADAYQTTTAPSSNPADSVNGVTYVYGTQLTSFDFSNPSAPVARSTLWLDGWSSSAVTATDRFFFIASTTDSTRSAIYVVDISSTNGTMAARGTIQPAGNVADKFKMGLNGDVFTVISQVWDWTNADNQTGSKLETFSLADPNAPAKLGELSIGVGDQLYATRIDTSRAYVVTAQQFDPLWVIDLTDPADPKVAGQLDVPGFSTFIQPLGNQLVTIGIVNDHVAISLFDVHDPAAPALLSSVAAGGTYSWSEAVWNEKAFSILPDAGLILVPLSGWDSESGFAAQVQLIDLGATLLTARGIINQPFEPRRATVFGTRILSISGHELLTVNATDRDHPMVTSDVALAWSVDRVFVQGNYLIEIENGGAWLDSAPTLRVASISDPDQVQSEIGLDGAPIVGVALRGGKLYLAQADSQNFGIVPLAAGTSTSTIKQPTTTVVNPPPLDNTTNPGSTDTKSTLTVSIYDLTQLPQLPLLGKTQMQIDPLRWGASLDALWPKPGVLVWADRGRNWGPILQGEPIITDARLVPGGTSTVSGGGNVLKPDPATATQHTAALRTPAKRRSVLSVTSATVNSGTTSSGSLTTAVASPGIADLWWWGGDSQGRLFAFDVTTASSPAFLSEEKFAPDAWSIGGAFTADGAIYASHAGAVSLDGTDTADQGWAQGWFLDVIDFTEPAAPVVRDPVSIPTTLIGISNATTLNATLFTIGWHVQNQSTSSQFLDASAYDGAAATLIDSVTLTGWSNSAIVDGSNVFIGKSTDNSGGAIDTWMLSSNNKLALLGSVTLDNAPWSLRALGDLLATQIGGQVVLFDKSDTTSLQQIGVSDGDSCFYGLNLDGADGDMVRGLWVPLGDYGVQPIDVNR